MRHESRERIGDRTLGWGFEPQITRLGGGCPIHARRPEHGDDGLSRPLKLRRTAPKVVWNPSRTRVPQGSFLAPSEVLPSLPSASPSSRSPSSSASYPKRPRVFPRSRGLRPSPASQVPPWPPSFHIPRGIESS